MREWASPLERVEHSAAERVGGVSGASEQTLRATEWPIKNAIVSESP